MNPTTHQIHFNTAEDMSPLADASVQLVVTSPPYPMIEMWDGIFGEQDSEIEKSLEAGEGYRAFEAMHQILDRVWSECERVLAPGGIACINIGDATRTIDSKFELYPNHSRIQTALLKLGFSVLPGILWRKPTNAPNKFMGSGMYPPGAYVTLEHEHILVFRKGNKRVFNSEKEKENRRQSAYFWEERNSWFSDVWFKLLGTRQDLLNPKLRARSAAYPFELPYTLIQMFSVMGDTVLDPFLGLGTTQFAAMATGRNSVGFEIDPKLKESIESSHAPLPDFAQSLVRGRLEEHTNFIKQRFEKKGAFKYSSRYYEFPVVTRQEIEIQFPVLEKIEGTSKEKFIAEYTHSLAWQTDLTQDWASFMKETETTE